MWLIYIDFFRLSYKGNLKHVRKPRYTSGASDFRGGAVSNLVYLSQSY